jgi:hypothetical protein
MEHHIVPLPALRFPFFGNRPSVAALSVQILDDVVVALFVAILAQFKDIQTAIGGNRSSTKSPQSKLADDYRLDQRRFHPLISRFY